MPVKAVLRSADYEIRFNPSESDGNAVVAATFEGANLSSDGFELRLGDKSSARTPEAGRIIEEFRLDAGESLPISISYHTVGLGSWVYSFEGAPRVEDFALAMTPNFNDYDNRQWCWPVRMLARLGVQDGVETKALLNSTPSRSTRSKFGVFTVLSPQMLA